MTISVHWSTSPALQKNVHHDATHYAPKTALHKGIVRTEQPTIELRHRYAYSPDMAFDAVPHTVQRAYAELVVPSNASSRVKRQVSAHADPIRLQQGGSPDSAFEHTRFWYLTEECDLHMQGVVAQVRGRRYSVCGIRCKTHCLMFSQQHPCTFSGSKTVSLHFKAVNLSCHFRPGHILQTLLRPDNQKEICSTYLHLVSIPRRTGPHPFAS